MAVSDSPKARVVFESRVASEMARLPWVATLLTEIVDVTRAATKGNTAMPYAINNRPETDVALERFTMFLKQSETENLATVTKLSGF